MNHWSNAVITQQGLSLQSKLIAGTLLNITKVEIGSGTVTPGLLMKQTMVTNPKVVLKQVAAITYPELGKCAVKININNDNISTGFTAMQIGFYANDPDDGEILYFIAQAEVSTGTIIPSKNEMAGYSAEWTIYFQYGQADSVNVTVDPANTITQEELEGYVKEKLRGYVAVVEKGAAGGVATLDDAGKVPKEQLPALDFVPTSDKGKPNGVATLDNTGKVPAEQMINAFDALAMQKGNKTTDELVTGPDGKDTWTSVVTSASGEELARKVDEEGTQPDGKAMWTTTITIAGQAPIVITDKETADGWIREVR